MITLKIKCYTKEEVRLLQKMLRFNIVTVQRTHCHTTCERCDIRHLCVDLQSAELFAEDVLNGGQG